MHQKHALLAVSKRKENIKEETQLGKSKGGQKMIKFLSI
jgi:hypothetical protein